MGIQLRVFILCLHEYFKLEQEGVLGKRLLYLDAILNHSVSRDQQQILVHLDAGNHQILPDLDY